jgi:flagellar P-ring protein FlgI
MPPRQTMFPARNFDAGAQHYRTHNLTESRIAGERTIAGQFMQSVECQRRILFGEHRPLQPGQRRDHRRSTFVCSPVAFRRLINRLQCQHTFEANAWHRAQPRLFVEWGRAVCHREHTGYRFRAVTRQRRRADTARSDAFDHARYSNQVIFAGRQKLPRGGVLIPAEFRAFCLARALPFSPRWTGRRNMTANGCGVLTGKAMSVAQGRQIVVIIRLLLAFLLVADGPVFGQIRIKDIADVEGVRSNQLIGYGLVVGLAGTGDKLDNSGFTRESLIGMLERLGVNTRDQVAKLQTKDLAAVMVTAELPAFTHTGSRIDVAVSALGDATNLTGGTLLVTPLLAANGEVYAVAQGAVATGAIAARGAAASVSRGVPTAGQIANGGIVEKEVAFRLDKAGSTLRLGLRNPDLTTALRIAAEINRAIGPISRAIDPRTVLLEVAARNPIEVLGQIENLRVRPDNPATVIIDEASGTIVMGDAVRISTVAVAQGNLTIRVTETPQISQPDAFSSGTTTTVPRTQIQVDDGRDKKLGILTSGVTLRELVASLNALGVGPRDMISILQSIKAAGALQADLQVR